MVVLVCRFCNRVYLYSKNIGDFLFEDSLKIAEVV